MSLRAGSLRHRVRLQRTDRTDDGAGGAVLRFIDVATIWAEVTEGRGRELFEAKKLNPKLTHSVLIRHRTTVKADMRFLYNGAALRIDSASDPDGTRESMVCLCEETVL